MNGLILKVVFMVAVAISFFLFSGCSKESKKTNDSDIVVETDGDPYNDDSLETDDIVHDDFFPADDDFDDVPEDKDLVVDDNDDFQNDEDLFEEEADNDQDDGECFENDTDNQEDEDSLEGDSTADEDEEQDEDIADEDVAINCTPNDVHYITCETDSTKLQKQVCNEYGQWENDGGCYLSECINNDSRNIPCGSDNKGFQNQICIYGIWTDSGLCTFIWKVVSSGGNHTCGIKSSDNKLYCWGRNQFGQLGDGSSGAGVNITTPTKIGDDSWSNITAGSEHTCGIKLSDNTLYCWGSNWYGQLGDGTSGFGTNKIIPTKIGDDSWSNISAGSTHTCGIKSSDNKLYCWGSNQYGQLGDGTTAEKRTPTNIGNDTWFGVTAGSTHTCGIKSSDNKLYCWGHNGNGQLGDGTVADKTTPINIGDDIWSDITAGSEHTCGIKSSDNKLYCWGKNKYGQLGDGTSGDKAYKTTPTKIGDDSWSNISAGSTHTCGIKSSDNKLYCWGYNEYGQLGDGTSGYWINKPTPTKIGDDAWYDITAGSEHTCGIKSSDNKLYCWGYNEYGQLGIGISGYQSKITMPNQIGHDSWSNIATGYQHTCGIKSSDNKLYCWGRNSYGQLGNGNYGTGPDEITPIKIGDDAWSNISAGSTHTCGIKSSDNKLYCWGRNQYGQLGDGTTADKRIPTNIGNDTWFSVTAGSVHTCGIRSSDNKLYCWGYNGNGRLGDGTTTEKRTPTNIGNDTWFSVTAGGGHTCGIKSSDNKLYCWGSNQYGQLGDGTTAEKRTPTNIGNDTWFSVTAGSTHTCGIKSSDNKLYCWGYNEYGQLGDGTSGSGTEKNTPTKISDNAWSNITANQSHTCGITENKLYCWGWNTDGQIGDGTSGWAATKNTPTKIEDDTWSNIEAGFQHTCGIKSSDNKLYCWGSNQYGQLGDGQKWKTIPQPVIEPE